MAALFSKKVIDGVYIPSGLLIVGCLIVKREWVPYAVVLSILLSGYKLLNGNRKLPIELLSIFRGIQR
jgi:cytochrome-b5 reductase